MTNDERDHTDKERAKTIHNESTKLASTYVNGLAIAIFAVGGLTVPLNSVSQGHPLADTVPLAVASFFVSACLHYLGQALLRRLR